MDQRAAERQLLLHAARELSGGPFEERIEAGRAGQIVDARLPLRLFLAEQAADEVEVLEHAEGRIKIAAEALRHVGDAGRAALPERCVLEVPTSARTSPVWIFRTPAISPSRVDLPTPSGPISPAMQPAGMASVTLSSATVLP